MSAEEFGTKPYAVRILPEAEETIEAVFDHITGRTGDESAREWLDGLQEALGHLATGPYRALAVESGLFSVEVRSLTYRKAGQSHRFLYVIREDSPDGPQVRIVHVRPATAGAMKAYEARNVEVEEADWDKEGDS